MSVQGPLVIQLHFRLIASKVNVQHILIHTLVLSSDRNKRESNSQVDYLHIPDIIQNLDAFKAITHPML